MMQGSRTVFTNVSLFESGTGTDACNVSDFGSLSSRQTLFFCGVPGGSRGFSGASKNKSGSDSILVSEFASVLSFST